MNGIHLLIVLAAGLGACQRVDEPPQGAAPAPSGSTSAASIPTPTPTDSTPMTSTGVNITLDRAQYRPRDMVTLTIDNVSGRDLGYNACTRRIEREAAGRWAEVPEPDRVCTMELRLLARGEKVTERTDLPALSAGRYRITVAFSDQSPTPGAAIRAVTAPFTVQ